MKTLSAIAVAAISTLTAVAHPGGLDSKGGHNDRKNGGYHYHRGNAAAATQSPQKVTAPEKSATVSNSVANPAPKRAPASVGGAPALARVTIGMTKAQVVAQLGEPNVKTGDVWLYSNEGFVRFKGERVNSIEAK